LFLPCCSQTTPDQPRALLSHPSSSFLINF